jgi:hypothetical protein
MPARQALRSANVRRCMTCVSVYQVVKDDVTAFNIDEGCVVTMKSRPYRLSLDAFSANDVAKYKSIDHIPLIIFEGHKRELAAHRQQCTGLFDAML